MKKLKYKTQNKAVLKYIPSSVLVSDPVLRDIVKEIKKTIDIEFDCNIDYEDINSCIIHQFKTVRDILSKGDGKDATTFSDSAWLEGLGSFMLSKSKLKYLLNKKDRSESTR